MTDDVSKIVDIMFSHPAIRKISILDSHTGGEPTRLVISGGPDLGRGSMRERQECFAREHDSFRTAVVNEPRGSDVIVGALLCDPVDPSCVAGVIYFNNVGYLGMCVHGTIGVVTSLAYLGRIGPGNHRIETPVGEVSAVLGEDGTVTVNNVPSYRYRADVPVEVPGYGRVFGDIAWAGNWFFLIADHGQKILLSNVRELSAYTMAVMAALREQEITGANGAEIDHIELFCAPLASGLDSSNFVMCPGGAYDRSPCGTGTSAKLACLYAAGKLQPGETWRQGGILGSCFEGTFRADGETILPSITGSAFMTAEATLLLDGRDPLREGIRI